MKQLEQTFRWYGPDDPVSLKDIRQSGATGIVTSLHHIPSGELWPIKDIQVRKNEIETAGLRWSVVESIPVHEDIKRRSGDYQRYIDNYKTTIQHLASQGIHTVTYNFMPVVDWTRTDLSYELPNGGKALRFELLAFAAFELYILKRPSAVDDYSHEIQAQAQAWMNNQSPSTLEKLTSNIIAGLPGGTTQGVDSLDRFQSILDTYRNINADRLRAHLVAFVEDIIDTVRACDSVLAIHPDDPPFSLLGLPRVMSTASDIDQLMTAVPHPSNGLCFCTGSLGVRADNDLPAIINKYGNRIHFIHLRSIQRDDQGNFHEADHLDGDVDMYEVMSALLIAQQARNHSIPMRPDHGHQLLDDLSKRTNPGYSAIGRLKGLAELRGLEMGILRSSNYKATIS